MLNQSLTTLNLPLCLLCQVQKVGILMWEYPHIITSLSVSHHSYLFSSENPSSHRPTWQSLKPRSSTLSVPLYLSCWLYGSFRGPSERDQPSKPRLPNAPTNQWQSRLKSRNLYKRGRNLAWLTRLTFRRLLRGVFWILCCGTVGSAAGRLEEVLEHPSVALADLRASAKPTSWQTRTTLWSLP